jgi:hypothetical protein
MQGWTPAAARMLLHCAFGGSAQHTLAGAAGAAAAAAAVELPYSPDTLAAGDTSATGTKYWLLLARHSSLLTPHPSTALMQSAKPQLAA